MFVTSKTNSHRSSLMLAVCGAGLLAFAAPTAAWAQRADPPPARSLSGLAQCRAVTDDAERLACYDRVVDTAGLGDQSRQFVAVDVQEAEAVERDTFGLDLSSLSGFSLSIFGGGDNELEAEAPETDTAAASTSGEIRPATPPVQDSRVVGRDNDGQVARIQLAVERVRLPGYNTLLVEMTNGQVWEVTDRGDKSRIARRIERAESVEIRRGSVGSYFLQVDGRGIAYRVSRQR